MKSMVSPIFARQVGFDLKWACANLSGVELGGVPRATMRAAPGKPQKARSM
jgi:hypothetical protein